MAAGLVTLLWQCCGPTLWQSPAAAPSGHIQLGERRCGLEPAELQDVVELVRHDDREGREEQDEVGLQYEGKRVLLLADGRGELIHLRRRALLGAEVHIRVLFARCVLRVRTRDGG
eukprot:scaffold42467_cov63-Phaeocystis_antarctica.AAC.4